MLCEQILYFIGGRGRGCSSSLGNLRQRIVRDLRKKGKMTFKQNVSKKEKFRRESDQWPETRGDPARCPT
jgi:hypothetical protein